MKTRLPFSTISYNSRPFLVDTLDGLVRSHILSEWYAIEHKPEDDEAGKKAHFHVFFVPSKSVQTDDIRQRLTEFDIEHPDKPRKCLSCRPSKFGHWYMYAIHDKAYLAANQQSRRYHYTYNDILCSDPDILHERFCEIDVVGELGAFKRIEAAIDQGLSFAEFCLHGQVPVQQVAQFRTAYDLMLSLRTDRNGHSGHVDEETGEVFDD